MFPPANLTGYLQLTFSKKMDELAQRHAKRVAEVRLTHPSQGGHRIKAILQPSVEHARERVEARLESIRDACKHANLPIDDEVRAFMVSEVHNLCDSSRKHVAQSARMVIQQEGMTPAGLTDSVLAGLDRQILGIESNLIRDLKIEELAAKAQSDAASNRPAPETKILVPVPPFEHSIRAIPWYKENPFWGNLSVFLGLLIPGVAFRLGGFPLLGRILMLLSWPFGLLILWIMVPNLSGDRRVKYVATAGAFVLFTVLFYMADSLLSRHSSAGAAVIPQPEAAGFLQFEQMQYVTGDELFAIGKPLQLNAYYINKGLAPAENGMVTGALSLQGRGKRPQREIDAYVLGVIGPKLRSQEDHGANVGVGSGLWMTPSFNFPLTQQVVDAIMQGQALLYVVTYARWSGADGNPKDVLDCVWLNPPQNEHPKLHDLVWHECLR
jgi:hypothetical protein